MAHDLARGLGLMLVHPISQLPASGVCDRREAGVEFRQRSPSRIQRWRSSTLRQDCADCCRVEAVQGHHQLCQSRRYSSKGVQRALSFEQRDALDVPHHHADSLPDGSPGEHLRGGIAHRRNLGLDHALADRGGALGEQPRDKVVAATGGWSGAKTEAEQIGRTATVETNRCPVKLNVHIAEHNTQDVCNLNPLGAGHRQQSPRTGA